MHYGLCFERFLNAERFRRGEGDRLPDIDLDFCWRRRDELLAEVCRRFGEDRVALLATYPALGFRAAYRAIDETLLARALGGDREAVAQLLARSPVARERILRGALGPQSRHREARILRGALHLTGLHPHLGLHPGGTVLAPGPMRDFAPVERSAKGLPSLQWDKEDAPWMGLVKIDLLGNRGLSIFADARRQCLRLGVAPESIDLDFQGELPERDPEAARLVREGRTLGCWQIESPAMRALLVRIAAEDLDDVIRAVALIRPGPAGSGMMDRYIRRKRGLEALPELPPQLARLLGESYGVLIYQEDLIEVLAALLGIDRVDADLFRRAIGAGSYYHPQRAEPGSCGLEARRFFFERARARGVPAELAEAFWTQIADFSAFSFCKAHAVTYGRLAWRIARLKARRPAAVLAAILANETGYYGRRTYVEEAKRCGVAVLPPCVNRGGVAFQAERLPGGRPAIRTGLGDVRSVPDELAAAIVREREEHGPYFAVEDLVRRLARRGLRPDERSLEHLILTGAFDQLEGSRPEKLWRQRIRARRGGAAALFAGEQWGRGPSIPCLPDFDERERARLELDLLGFTTGLSPSPLEEPAGPEALPLGEIPEHVGEEVTITGALASLRRHRTRQGRWMCFLTLEDETGIAEVCVFPNVYANFGLVIAGGGRYRVRGRIEVREGALAVHALSLARA